MLDFLLSYWRILVLIILIIINVLISLFKKPKVINTIVETINAYVPNAINEAERVLGPGTGAKKLEYAYKLVIDYLSYRFNYDYSYLSKYEKYIYRSIEMVLSTPEKKKGDSNG